MHKPKLALNDLLDALLWVDAEENAAYIDRKTGKIYFISPDFESEEAVPDDVETSDAYLAVPNKHTLDLGRALFFSFVEQELPEKINVMADIFRRKRAYRHAKDWLASEDKLDQWYAFEQQETQRALQTWCEEEGIQLIP